MPRFARPFPACRGAYLGRKDGRSPTRFFATPATNAGCPICPDFLQRLLALIHSMRLSLMKGAHADLSSTAWQEIGVKPHFGLSGRMALDVPLPIRLTTLNYVATLNFVIPSGLRISYTLHPPTATYAAFSKESRMRFNDATEPDRKSGGSRGTCCAPSVHATA
jgi:hypothetical protein